jgi:hypothetical protein
MVSSGMVFHSLREPVRMENANNTVPLPQSETYPHESNGARGTGCLCPWIQKNTEGGHEKSCCLCEMIYEKSRSDWAFEWILKLRDWENTLSYENECHQLTFDLTSEGSADIADRIRDKLGTLQTEMVLFFMFFTFEIGVNILTLIYSPHGRFWMKL